MELSEIVDRHSETLRRILGVIFVYCGLADFTPDAARLLAVNGAGAARGFQSVSDPWTMSRRVHRWVRALLMPAEAAARRLIIALAADLPTPKLRPFEIRRCKRGWTAPKAIRLKRTFEPGVTVPRFLVPGSRPAWKPPVRMPRFALLDPLKRFDRKRRPKQRCFPRILTFETPPVPLPVRQTPHDKVPNRHLMRRVTALAAALDDLPAQAKRFARWRAFRDLEAQNPDYRTRRRLAALRPGHPPGSPPMKLPRDRYREEHTLLADTHYLATQWRPRRDSS